MGSFFMKPEIKSPPMAPVSEEKDAYWVDDNFLHILQESLEEIDEKGKDLFKNLFSDVKKEVALGELIREELGELMAKDLFEKIWEKLNGKKNYRKGNVNAMIEERGIDIDSTSQKEEVKQKLERFKVKTVKLGGNVNQDQK